MPAKKVTQLRKFCGLLAGHSRQQAERVAEAAIESIRQWLPVDLTEVNLRHYLLCLGDKLEYYRERLTEIDDLHMRELQGDRNLREERDVATVALRERLLQMRFSLDGLFGTGGGGKIFAEAPRIPTDPVALLQLTGRVIGNLDDQNFPMPEPLQQGFKLDREGAIQELAEPFLRLDSAIKTLETAESESKHSQARKDQEVLEVHVFTGKMARFLEAFFDLAGFDGLSDRVRRSSHRADDSTDAGDPGPTEAGGEGEVTGSDFEPAAGAPAADVSRSDNG